MKLNSLLNARSRFVSEAPDLNNLLALAAC